MGQDSTWHLQQLNQYVSAFTSGLSGGDNFTTITTTISINSSVISNSSSSSSSNGLVRHHHQQQFHPSNNTSSSLLSTSAHRELQNFSQAIAERLTAAAVSQLTSTSNDGGGAATQSTTYHVDVDDADTNTVIWNNWLLLLIVLYCIVVFGGIFGNASLVLTLYTQTSTRLRNPLLVALCLADLMVTGVAAPLTVVTLVLMVKRSWTFSSVYACKSIYFLQSMPVAASTISLLMLSLDRYATVKHPRLAQLRQRRFLPDVLAFGSWISAIIVSIPILIAYNITTNDMQQQEALPASSSTSPSSTSMDQRMPATNFNLNNPTIGIPLFVNANGSSTMLVVKCQADFGTAHMQTIFLTIYTLFVFILPGIGVVLNHLGVRQKLCALSLTARAAHGELPLPMPILRRPTHVIIVTGMANAAAVRDDDDDDSTNDNPNQNEHREERRHMMDSTRLRPTPRTPRSLRYGHSIRSHAANPPSELPLPQTSTLRSRRRLANMLVAGSLVFVLCWTPHVICLVCSKFAANECCSKTMSDYYLLLGYTHSALNPILHWALNHNSLRQSSFLLRLTSVQRFLRTHLRDRHHQPPPSSTNEAALGPFNPRYIKARPQQQYHAPPASSHLLY